MEFIVLTKATLTHSGIGPLSLQSISYLLTRSLINDWLAAPGHSYGHRNGALSFSHKCTCRLVMCSNWACKMFAVSWTAGRNMGRIEHLCPFFFHCCSRYQKMSNKAGLLVLGTDTKMWTSWHEWQFISVYIQSKTHSFLLLVTPNEIIKLLFFEI